MENFGQFSKRVAHIQRMAYGFVFFETKFTKKVVKKKDFPVKPKKRNCEVTNIIQEASTSKSTELFSSNSDLNLPVVDEEIIQE